MNKYGIKTKILNNNDKNERKFRKIKWEKNSCSQTGKRENGKN
jgi:hypothetical protein